MSKAEKTPCLGLVSISFRSHSPEEIAAAAAEAGLSFVEWGSDVHAPCTDTKRLADLVRLQETYGLSCSSYGTYFWLGETPLAELPAYFEAAKALGTNVVRLWCGNKSTAAYTEDETQALFAACREAASLAKAHDMVIGLECHPNTYTEECEGALSVMQAIHSSAFRMYWQPNQYKSVEENIAYAKAIAPYTVRIHTYNWNKEERMPLKDSVTVWRQYRSCFDHSVPLLLEFMPNDRIEELFAETNALKEIVL